MELVLIHIEFFGDHTLLAIAIVMAYLYVISELCVHDVPVWKRGNTGLAEMPHNSAMAV